MDHNAQKLRDYASIILGVMFSLVVIAYLFVQVINSARDPLSNSEINITNIFAKTRAMERLMNLSMQNAGIINNTGN